MQSARIQNMFLIYICSLPLLVSGCFTPGKERFEFCTVGEAGKDVPLGGVRCTGFSLVSWGSGSTYMTDFGISDTSTGLLAARGFPREYGHEFIFFKEGYLKTQVDVTSYDTRKMQLWIGMREDGTKTRGESARGDLLITIPMIRKPISATTLPSTRP